MTIQSIFAITDFSSQAEQGLERAALLAQAHAATLSVMYATEEPNPKFSDPFARLEQRARQLARRHNIGVKTVARSGSLLDDILRQCQRANLLVLDQRSHRCAWKFWQGTTLDHLLRHSPCPVLVVKKPPTQSYARLLVAVGPSEASQKLVGHASGFALDAELELFHALPELGKARAGSTVMSPELVNAYRQRAHASARDRLFRFTDSSHARRNRVSAVSGQGEPARQISVQQESSKADLIVVGKERRSTLVGFAFRSVAQRVTQWARSDVLVVPNDYRPPSGATAAARILALPLLPQHQQQRSLQLLTAR